MSDGKKTLNKKQEKQQINNPLWKVFYESLINLSGTL